MDAFSNFLTGTITLFSDPLGIAIFIGGVLGGMLFGAAVLYNWGWRPFRKRR